MTEPAVFCCANFMRFAVMSGVVALDPDVAIRAATYSTTVAPEVSPSTYVPPVAGEPIENDAMDVLEPVSFTCSAGTVLSVP